MSKPTYIELPTGEKLTILFEDRSVMAIDKPPGWMLVPVSWQNTRRNLQAALLSSIAARDFWARSRNLKFLKFIHRLDAETSGVLLFGKSPGAVASLADLFETRAIRKTYLAVVEGVPEGEEWTCSLPIGIDERRRGRMRVDARGGKPAETHFRLLQSLAGKSLVEARPVTGRTHQIRLHLAAARVPVANDEWYGTGGKPGASMALRSVRLAYVDPFTRRRVDIRAETKWFLKEHGFPESAFRFEAEASPARPGTQSNV